MEATDDQSLDEIFESEEFQNIYSQTGMTDRLTVSILMLI